MKNLIAIVIMVFTVNLVVAQSAHERPTDRPLRPNIEQLQKDLGLSESQVVTMKALHKKMEAHGDAAKGQKPSEAERQKAHEKMKAEMASILTKEQLRKMEQLRGKQKRQKSKDGCHQH